MSGGGRVDELEYPDEQLLYYRYADKFGWTPSQVDELPLPLADWLLSIANVVEEIKIEAMNKQ